MILEIDLKVKGWTALSRREMNSIVKEAYFLTGRRWRHRFLPLHFGDQASRRYGYHRRAGQKFAGKPRPGSYSARKQQFLGHQRPLEFSGDGKRRAMREEKIAATSKRVTVRLPRKFNFRASGSRVRMADEIREVRRDEAGHLTKFLADYIRNTLRQSGASGATVSSRIIES